MQTAISNTVAIRREVLINLGVIATSALSPAEKWDTAWYLLEEFCGTSQPNGSTGAGTGARTAGLNFDYLETVIPKNGIAESALVNMLAGEKHGFRVAQIGTVLARAKNNARFSFRDGRFYCAQAGQSGDGITGSTTAQNQETRQPVAA